ncbi:cysteine-rich CWC family protein [Pseudomonadota bacterium]
MCITKTCPRCKLSFECKTDDVTNCQCASVKLNQSQRDYIFQQFDDCLCASCLEQLRDEAGN